MKFCRSTGRGRGSAKCCLDVATGLKGLKLDRTSAENRKLRPFFRPLPDWPTTVYVRVTAAQWSARLRAAVELRRSGVRGELRIRQTLVRACYGRESKMASAYRSASSMRRKRPNMSLRIYEASDFI
ncbi:hypothetical protein EVAR_65385_1 [Eumeta japonica]|uniref:Uncharacterized protein n=1 Tax=Eumeta variegata TaxID=151549 RepID=A0A4C1ZYM8_EUMVA|nr:hypothetical protein EVAR_65385_1 [Eumeta japonica]